jgi:short subunit dehydrogenase-like uncharacterized protein
MSDPLMIYGATGYTGGLIAREATARGLRPVLSGRDGSRVAAMAERLGLEHRAAGLGEPARLDAALDGMRVLLNAAGPFSQTAQPVVEACLRCGTHYLDLTGEIAVIEALARRDAVARQRKIMIMPAVGFEVVPSDCLAAHVARRLPGAQRLALGLKGLGSLSRGSARTLAEAAGVGVVRRSGALARIPLGSLQRSFDYGDGPQASLNLSWGDVATAYFTTGIATIETYCEATPLVRAVFLANRYFGSLLRSAPGQVLLRAQADMLPDGPSADERARLKTIIVADATDGCGRRVTSRLCAPEAYTFSAMTAAAVASHALQGDIEVGFQTPARVYGADFVLSFSGVRREDLQ